MKPVSLFRYHHRRAVYARYAARLHGWWVVFIFLSVMLILLGVLLLAIQMPLGYPLLGFAVVPLMIVTWYRRFLLVLPVESEESVAARLDKAILGMLPENPSPRMIAEMIAKTNPGTFFAVRFGIGGLLNNLASPDPNDTEELWRLALEVAQQTGGEITVGSLSLALVRQQPGIQTLLGHLHLDESDIIEGIRWHNRLQAEIEASHTMAKHPGGVGRDWSFGWTPMLNRLALNISYGSRLPSDDRKEVIDHIVQSLEGPSSSLVLVGPLGVGKTELMYELAARLMHPELSGPSKLQYHQVMLLDSTRLMSIATQPGQLEQLMVSVLNEAVNAKNTILCLDDAELFFEEGVGSVDLSKVLLPVIESGRIPMILAMDQQRYLDISKRLPALASAMQKVMIQQTDEPTTMRILQQQVPILESRRKVVYTYQALKEAYRLSQRYIYDVSMPGQALRLLESAAEHNDGGLVSADAVNKAIQASTGVKTAAVADDEEREILLNLEDHLHQRVVGQDHAIEVVADALRRARAGIRNQNRPVGTFLFLGPTGVGKTELAKALADVYYGGEETIIRLDMNEFVSPKDVQRLIADGTQDANSLTARVMKQPFSVVLLDEIEKADSSVLTTLLQLLDEGILRDATNREVSFRDTIVIATSNAGADRIQEYLQRGYALEQFEEKFVDELINSHIFHPEFLNRFDEMIVFQPLDKQQLLSVVDRIVDDLNQNLAAKKITVSLAKDAKEVLVDAGYDPRLGARPMRRIVQRAVESTVAKQLLSGVLNPGDTYEMTADDVSAIVKKKETADEIATDSSS